MKVVIVLCALLPLLAAQTTESHLQCHRDSDCGDGQCCTKSLFHHHLTGHELQKRFLLDDIFNHFDHGHCMGLAVEGQYCEPDLSAGGASTAHHLGCPCAQGLECHGEQEQHNGGSHSYTNPRCIAEGTYTGPTAEPTTTVPATD